MTIQEAITKAIEGGWQLHDYKKNPVDTLHEAMFKVNDALLDPLFWQALGKEMGWKECKDKECPDSWLCYWHHLIEHLVSGGSIESFFQALK